MSAAGPEAAPAFDERAPVFVISVAAELSGMHPQTLRQYDRVGLVTPRRTSGRGRRYSARDVEKLRQVQQLSQEEGINLAGIKRILELEDQVRAMQSRLEEAARFVGGDEESRPGSATSRRIFAADADGQVTSLRRGQRPERRAAGRRTGALVLYRPAGRA